MSKVYLTDRMVKLLEAEGGRVEAWDTVIPGLGLRYSGRKKTWFFVYHSPELLDAQGRRRRRRMTLGEYPKTSLAEARAEGAQLRETLRRGLDPALLRTQAPKRGIRFRDLAEKYVEQESKPKKARWDCDVSALRSLLPVFGDRLVESITTSEIVDYLDQVAKRGPWVPRDHRRILSRILEWGVLKFDQPRNAARAIPRDKPRPRERVLSPEEVGRMWRVCSQPPFSLVGLQWRLRLVTGQRGAQLRRMNVSQLERDSLGLWWNVPSSITKTSKPNRLFLSPLAESVLASVPPHPEGWIFQSPPPKRMLPPGGKEAVNRIRRSVGATADWKGMDLRRTAATWMARGGVPRFIVKRVLGHADHDITAVYDLYSYDREVKAAVLILEQAIREAIGEAPPAEPFAVEPMSFQVPGSSLFFPQFPGLPR